MDGRYQIESVLGMGGMGMVFRATQMSMRRAVALKTLHPSLAAAPQFFERFRREAETASRLVHPNIITIFDFGRAEDGTCFFVMELVEGESLKQIVKREGPMSLRRAVEIIEQTANGLQLAHHQQVVHRDLKPHNLLVSTVNRQDLVKILDFGLVKALEQEEDEQLTSTGQVLGTPQYMPPEQAGGEAVDARSDLYSLTGVLYYCLTGSSPFGANTVRKALQAALTQSLPPVATRRQGAPVGKGIEEFLRKGLAAEKVDRHQSTEEFIEELHAAISSLSDAELDALPFNDGGVSRESGSGSDSRRSGKTPSSQGARSARNSNPPSNIIVEEDPHATRSSGGNRRNRPTSPDHPARGRSQPHVAAPVRKPSLAIPLVVGAAVVLIGGAVGFAVTRQDSPVPAPVADPAPQVISLDAPRTSLSVKLTSSPEGAEVFEGEVYRGKTPLELSLGRDGIHPFTFKLEGHTATTRTVDLNSVVGDAFQVDVALQRVAPTGGGRKKKTEDIPIFE
ncbi:MAG: protein kinase [Myxococcota bacterium]|nr:protein kinase [Myxococcota bacterium]